MDYSSRLRCMGEKGNVVFELAKDKNVLASGVDDANGYYNLVRSDGEKIPRELCEKIIEMGLNIYRSDKYDEEKPNYHGSMGNFIAEKLAFLGNSSNVLFYFNFNLASTAIRL